MKNNLTTAQKIERLEAKAENIKGKLNSLKAKQAAEGYKVAFSEILQIARANSEFIGITTDRELGTTRARWTITMIEPLS